MSKSNRERQQRARERIAQAQIQLEVGTPLVAPEQITFPDGL